MSEYQPPQIIATHSANELAEQAATCIKYASDAALKEDVTRIDRPLGGLGHRRGA